MSERVNNNIELENARIIFRNFAGVEGKYNRAGDRNFGVVISDPELANILREDGWNIRILAPREEGDEPTYWLPVAVKYGNFPPHIYMISGRKKILMDEDSISELDNADVESVDIVIRPYNWETNAGTGVKAYCKTMYVVCRRDRFAGKYDFSAEVPLPDEPPF